MRKIIMFLFALFSVAFLSALIVDYKGKMASESITIIDKENADYFCVNELDKVFKARISSDLLDGHLKINLYNEQFIFLLDSPYFSYIDASYNCENKVLMENGRFYLSRKFLTEFLPRFIPDKISFVAGILTVSIPVDNSIKRILLDPGHGGKDPGALGFSKQNMEKDVVLEISRKLKKQLEKLIDAEIILTRFKDEFVSLQDRTEMANEKQCDLFISVHCNAHRSNKAHGIEVYYLSTAKTDEARAVEALENSVVYEYEGGEQAVKKYDDLAFILADMAQNEHLQESYDLCLQLQKSLVKKTGCFDRGVKQANFYVLRGAFMPAVLLELGFLSNKKEEQKLIDPEYQDKLVNSICNSIIHFKEKIDRMY